MKSFIPQSFTVTYRAVIFLLALALICPLAAQGRSQQPTVDLGAREITIEQAIGSIEAQTGMVVGVNHKVLDVSRRITVPSQAMALDELMQRIVAGTGNTFTIRGRHIVIVADDRPVVPAEPQPPVKVVVGQEAVVTINEIASDKVFSFAPCDAPSMVDKAGALPKFAIKTNLSHGLITLTPNLGVEFGMGRRTTLEITAGYNPWNRNSGNNDKKRKVHAYIQPEFRLWSCERFNGHFFGVHGLGASYDISGHNLDMLKFKNDYRYKGYAAGGGLSYGYGAMLSPAVGVEFTAGLGVLWLRYDRYERGAVAKERLSKVRFTPTKAAISLVFLIK